MIASLSVRRWLPYTLAAAIAMLGLLAISGSANAAVTSFRVSVNKDEPNKGAMRMN